MTDEQWQSAWKLFQSGSSVPPEEIRSFLKNATGDLLVRDAVIAMLDRTPKVETLDRVGQRIGRYVLTERLGEGGMGEVYAARDSDLGRPVAVKLLAPSAIGTSSPVDRFIQEAKAASALNHPNIVTIYEVIHATSRLAIVMELIDGISLRRLCGSPLPMDRVLHMGEQIARALAAAHARGIVHCDIKPENLMVRPDGFVKVLDFGLARDLASIASSSVLPAGTLRYMSPEQSRGEAPSQASDIFSLGIVLYELAAGTHPFESGSIFETLKALNQAEPTAPSSLNAFVPAHLDALILRMLAVDSLQRPPASEVAQLLESHFSSQPARLPASGGSKKRAPKSWRKRWWVASALAALLTTALAAVLWTAWRTPSQLDSRQPLVQLDLDVGDEVSQMAISPDGSQVVFLKGNQLVLRRLDQASIVPLAGTEGASYPFFAPDGKWVAFFSGGKLRKIAVTGGAPVTLCDAQSGRGGSWGDDGRIVATLSSTGGLFQVASSGGAPRPLTDLTGERPGVTSHRWPQVLPKGRGVLFTAAIAGGAIGSLRVLPGGSTHSKPSGAAKTLVENAPYGRFLTGGYLVYYRNGKLFAVAFNPETLEIAGPAVLLVDRVAADTVRGAVFEVSLSGTLLYRAGNEETGRTLFWLNSSGISQPIAAQPGAYLTPRLAPDGKRLAVAVTQGGEQHLWVYTLDSGFMKRLTFDDSEAQLLPVWTADGEFVAFRSGSTLAWVRSDGSGKVERLESASLNPLPYSFSPDGKYLAFAGDDPSTGLDLYVAPVERAAGGLHLGPPQALMRQAGGQYSPAISPGDRWLAYTSDESGRAEIYVTAFSPGSTAQNAKWQVSAEGGTYPVWSRDGRELLYRSADRHVMAVHYVGKGGTFVADKPQVWPGRRLGVAGGFPSFDVAPNGSRVVGIFESEESNAEQSLRVVLNVAGEVRRRVARQSGESQ